MAEVISKTYDIKVNLSDGTQLDAGTISIPTYEGPAGRDYFFYSNITDLGKVPAAKDGFDLRGPFENRTPVVGDRFIGVFKYGTQSFIATCRVDRDGHAIISLVVETTGAEGPPVSTTTVSITGKNSSGTASNATFYTSATPASGWHITIDDGEL